MFIGLKRHLLSTKREGIYRKFTGASHYSVILIKFVIKLPILYNKIESLRYVTKCMPTSCKNQIVLVPILKLFSLLVSVEVQPSLAKKVIDPNLHLL